jgi:hypothetical protein
LFRGLVGSEMCIRDRSWKDRGTHLFARIPFLFQAVFIAFSVFLMYQAISDTFKPFVYFQF